MNTALRPHIALIRRDLKATAGFMTLILAINLLHTLIMHILLAIIGIRSWPYFYYTHKTFSSFSQLIYRFEESEIFILAAFFAVIINLEWNAATRNQTLFLPVRRFSHLLLMMLAIWISGWIIYSIPEIFNYLYYLSIRSQLWYGNILTPHYSHYLDRDIFIPAQELFLLSGMVCLAQGVMVTIRRYRFAVWVLTFFMAASAYSFVSYRTNHEFGLGLDTWGGEAFWGTIGWETGAIFLLIGLLLFDRFAEV